MRIQRVALAGVVVLLGLAVTADRGRAGGEKKKADPSEKKTDKAEKKTEKTPKAKEVWTDRNDPTLPADYQVQGEYVGQGDGQKYGAQVIALGGGALQAVLLPGGLPGAGWDGKSKSLLAGQLTAAPGEATFAPAEGKRKYLAGSPKEFAATAKFPPAGQQPYKGAIKDGTFTLAALDGGGAAIELKKTERLSPTLGAKPPEGARVLFDGTNTDEWKGGRLDKATGWLNTDGGDVVSKRTFNNYTVHLEFLLPYRPAARDQGRGNSGFYQVHHYEVQVLDSFGLEGRNNECGGIYTKAAPTVNMCLPPLTWQTYDIDFTNAVADGGKTAKGARITARHNGVVIHDDVEIKGVTGGSRGEPVGTPGPFLLQGHGNPLQYRNIWVVEKQ